MRHKISIIVLLTTMIAIAGWGYNKNQVKLSDSALDNINALTGGIDDGDHAPDDGDGGGGGGSIDQSGYRYIGSPTPCCEPYAPEFKCSSVWKDC